MQPCISNVFSVDVYASSNKSEQKQKPQKFSIGRVGREKRVKGGELLLTVVSQLAYTIAQWVITIAQWGIQS